VVQNPLEHVIAELLTRRSLTLAVAESCTGGLLAHRVTNVSGSSAYFLGGIVAYSNAAKERLLGVRHETLETWGAVSAETAVEMARGARQTFASDLALSITGIAGPTGGTLEKPVGLTFIGLVAPDGEWVERHVWGGNREANKTASAEAALDLLHRYLRGELVGKQGDFAPTVVESRLDSEGQTYPTAFTWMAQRQQVRDVGRRWIEGDERCYLVMTSLDAVFELRFHVDRGSWRARPITTLQALA